MSNVSSTRSSCPSFFERYRLLSNRRGEDAWSILFGYPVARFLVVPLISISWVTPTRLTLLGFAIKIACIAAIWPTPGVQWPIWSIVLLLQSAQIVDSMDGTLARARNEYSKLGAFLDKSTDAIGFYGLCIAVGVRAMATTGDWHYIVLGGIAGACFLQLCYMYWVVKSAMGVDNSGAAMAGGGETLSWKQLFREWCGGFPKLLSFGEADMYLWVALFAIAERWDLCVYLLVFTQGIAMLKRAGDHCGALARLDREP